MHFQLVETLVVVVEMIPIILLNSGTAWRRDTQYVLWHLRDSYATTRLREREYLKRVERTRHFFSLFVLLHIQFADTKRIYIQLEIKALLHSGSRKHSIQRERERERIVEKNRHTLIV